MRPTSTIVGRMLASAGRTVDERQADPSGQNQATWPEPVLASVLPDGIRACLFDLDGVLTQTSRVHAVAWKQMFDAFLLDRSRLTGEPFRAFEVPADYAAYVDGKLPAPDMFLAAAAALGVHPAQAAVFEDAIAGVQAGRAGAFGWVVGVDRVGQADALRRHGADRVVSDLSELLPR
jgi:beta-phosphoglucomutase-like phosphatase (HAD superfamily)